jgi:DNA-binding CsgD family transcriptional regulator/tetratricopeptide (TPR) repeat protein
MDAFEDLARARTGRRAGRRDGAWVPEPEEHRGIPDGLIGRRHELAQIEALLHGARPGQARLLQITGESGIGKTRLLSHMLERAREDGYVTVMGRAAEFEADEPFGVLLSGLDQALALPEQALRDLDPEDTRELLALFPTLATRTGLLEGEPTPFPSGAGVERYRLHRAIAALLDVLAPAGRLLLAVDDMHWADPASIELLLYLLRRPPRSQLVLAITYRDGQLDAKTVAALQQLQRDSHGELIELRPLNVEEASALFPADLPSSLAELIYNESGGNPFYLEALVRATRLAAGADWNGGARQVPSTVSAVIAGELERLSPSAREVIQAASVVGDPFEPELAGEVVDMPEPDTLTAVDELLDCGLVQHAAVPGRFSFRHPIVRRAVYESAKGGWRRSAHARAAAVLAARGAPASARARHVERSARLGDEQAIEVLTQAGYATNARAPATAARWFRAALRLLPEQHEPAQRIELLLALAVSLGAAGILEESRESFQEVLGLLDHGDPLRSSAVAGAAIVEHLLGKHDEGQGLLLAALAELDERSADAATLKLVIADGCFFSADWDGMRYWAQRALELDDPPKILRAGVAAALALAHYGLGDTTAAAAAASEAAMLADGLPDAELASQLQSICFLGWAEYCVGRAAEAEQHMRRALDVAAATGQQHLSAAMLVVKAMCNLALGRLDLACEEAETAIDTSTLSSNQLFLTWALTVRCMVEIETASPASAARYGRRALEAGVASRSPWSSVANLYLAEAHLEAGEPEHFRKELFAGQSTPRLPPFRFYAVHAYELLTRAELELELPDAAARWASQASEIAHQLDLPGPSAQAQRAQAMLLLASGAPGSAARLAQSSAEQAEQAGQPLHGARSRLLAGIALSRDAQHDEAIAELRRAEQTFAAHGAVRYRDRAARELRRLGVHASTTRRTVQQQHGIGALSERELAVARLVHEGRSNRQIAEELSIGVKTVETHLTNIFRRLEITSRSQLATLVERSLDVLV